ncbi:GCK domain-containing protein [Tripterygium wilfordii]|uniref:GCK domain-containing protein n=2 Tax=Tripterygium wilfordii TaxID=458696 RepID=A0A7J7E1V6_TRIWF|nr:GCK domain-containing protein [Tripterygium wilfordii]
MSSPVPKSETLESPTPSDSSVDNKSEQDSLESKNLEQSEKDREGEDGKGEGGGEEEEEGECGFCLFMKAGGCRESFIAWENCIEAAEKNKEDIVDKCFEVTGALKKCMEAHADYYEPILMAEKAVEEEAKKELENEKKAEGNVAANEKKAEGNVTENEKTEEPSNSQDSTDK